MPDRVVLDIIDRPANGLPRALRRLGALRRGSVPHLRAAIPLGTARFAPSVIPRPTPRRVGALTVWDDGADVEASWEELLGPLADGAHEHWHLQGEVTRTAFTAPWGDWAEPRTDGAAPLTDDEPALILISGELKARWLPAFSVDAAKAMGQALGEEGYLGGLAIQSSPLNTTSCSAWATYADARRYAYASGRHQSAMKRDKSEEHHRTEHFVRVRPLAERGMLDGTAPFAAVLGAQPVGVTR